jgi:hypothetical protein
MSYLLFISYKCGLKHNCVYNTLEDVFKSIEQMVTEEGLIHSIEQTLTVEQLCTFLTTEDDYVHQLSNGTWYHIQMHPVFSKHQM